MKNDSTEQDLAKRLADPGFTPGVRHFPALFALLTAERELSKQATRVLARAGLDAARAALLELTTSPAAARARLIELVGRVARVTPAPELVAAIVAALSDEDSRTRRSAIRAVGNLAVPDAEERLLALWQTAGIEERRALAAVLGKVGQNRALAVLSADTTDPELGRIAKKSRLMLARTLQRSEPSQIDCERELPESALLCIRCRQGVARLLAEEASQLSHVQTTSDGEAVIAWRQALQPLLALRTALDFGIVAPLAAGSSLEARIVETLTSSKLRAALGAWTRGTIRFRLAFAEGGHRRATVWRLAAAIAEHAPELVNDPTQAPWEFIVEEDRERLLLCPRGFDDPRFAYRKSDVRGASHPTIAAALARQAGARDDDVIWDPFAGGGLELIERAKLGPYHELHGSDLDAGALDAARENLRAANLTPTSLLQADARSHRVLGATLIVTNPPMGRRVARAAGLFDLLSAFLENAARSLAPGGRLVWLSPMPERTARAARALGFDVRQLEAIDLGGFHAELQHCRK